ncbi:carboxypeptidase-like regulatory domain-containing protein [Terriglobus sp. RCC_193]|uniref:carboxypeptidase-like regulatory domain-containing protein n=1 Tax=Terriglobus sp. RCC_193 TaxID=3239218 RepID=UPI003524B2A0
MTRFRTTHLLFAGVLLLAPVLFHGASAHAQAAVATRNVTGTVVDKSGAAVKGAVVHLKDARALSQRSYITAEDGQFRFAQLSTSTDYELWADLNGRKSDSKNLSSFDNKKVQDITLKLP